MSAADGDVREALSRAEASCSEGFETERKNLSKPAQHGAEIPLVAWTTDIGSSKCRGKKAHILRRPKSRPIFPSYRPFRLSARSLPPLRLWPEHLQLPL
jgi:hypothetical protein